MKALLFSLIFVALLAPRTWADDTSSQTSSGTTQKHRIDLQKDFDSLGDNDAVVEKAKALDPKNKYKVVQSRLVDRNMRLELGVNAGLVGGGDSYYSTNTLGANLDFHINPNWSVGGRYYHSFNTLTSEGNTAFQNAENNRASGLPYTTPAIDYPSDTTLGVVSWYPIYGKLNMFDMGVSHFDIYMLGGYGVTSLSSGTAGTLALGGGFGFWFTNWLAMRLEGRYQTYNDHPYYDTPAAYTRQVNDFVGMASIGFLL